MKTPFIYLAYKVLCFAIITLSFEVPVTRKGRIRIQSSHVTDELDTRSSIKANDLSSKQSIQHDIDRRAAELRLNQRKLIREMKHTRSNSWKALEILGSAYQHLAISSEEMHTIGDGIELSFEQLLDILYRDDSILSDATLPVVIDGKSTSMAIEILCKARNVAAAIILLKRSTDGCIHNRKLHNTFQYQSILKSDNNELCTIYKSVLSMLGRTQSKTSSDQNDGSAAYSDLTLHLLLDYIPSVAKIEPELVLYHAALNALGKQGSSEAISTLMNDMKDPAPEPDRMAYQIGISSLAKSGKCLEATQLLHQMRLKSISPDITCYNELLIGIARQAGRRRREVNEDISWHKLALDILQDIESQSDLALSITDQTYNSIISACGKEKAWDAASSIARKASNSTAAMSSIGTGENDEQNSPYFRHLDIFHKNGKGNYAYWDIAEYRSRSRTIIVGIQPHRNPKRNGMSLVFYQNSEKVGRVLLKNDNILSPSTNFYYSSIIGMEVNAKMRGGGLSKVLIAIWLDICLKTEAYPRAAVMNKPLISLVLSKFGFTPDEGGTKCALVRLKNNDDDDESIFGLYSPQKSLDGVFSHRVLRTQNMKLLRSLPDSDGGSSAEVVIKTTFSHPYNASSEMERERAQLESKINTTLNLSLSDHIINNTESGEMKYHSSIGELRKAFLFF